MSDLPQETTELKASDWDGVKITQYDLEGNESYTVKVTSAGPRPGKPRQIVPNLLLQLESLADGKTGTIETYVLFRMIEFGRCKMFK
jgi:hypothetical protein